MEYSIIFNTMLQEVVSKYEQRVHTVFQPWLNHINMAHVVTQKGAAVQNVWAFLDGTHVPVCQPTWDQRDIFSGHKRCHSLKF